MMYSSQLDPVLVLNSLPCRMYETTTLWHKCNANKCNADAFSQNFIDGQLKLTTAGAAVNMLYGNHLQMLWTESAEVTSLGPVVVNPVLIATRTSRPAPQL